MAIGLLRNAVLIAAAVVAAAVSAQVKPGIEVLRERGFDALRGKRVGLITNPTGVDNNLKSTIDILHESPEVNLVALFAPEHGVRGDIPAGQKVAAARDAASVLRTVLLPLRPCVSAFICLSTSFRIIALISPGISGKSCFKFSYPIIGPPFLTACLKLLPVPALCAFWSLPGRGGF